MSGSAMDRESVAAEGLRTSMDAKPTAAVCADEPSSFHSALPPTSNPYARQGGAEHNDSAARAQAGAAANGEEYFFCDALPQGAQVGLYPMVSLQCSSGPWRSPGAAAPAASAALL